MRASVALGVVALEVAASPAWAEEPQKAATQEVEVRGTPLSPAAGPLDASVSGSTLRRAELEQPGLTAPEALRTEVGTSITETGGLGAASTASIRGATAAETPVYVGGVRINDDVAGAADLSTVPLWLMDPHRDVPRQRALRGRSAGYRRGDLLSADTASRHARRVRRERGQLRLRCRARVRVDGQR